MDPEIERSQTRDLSMATEDHYRQKAECYRSSEEYNKMINLYPILQTSIKDCKNETLVA